ncbi:flagellar protein FliS [Planctomycetes bacterium Pla163]|uniref:Flagellar protein FliS n=1 Tax=Rohdeia mirabilis TaxID=2528008 RepID=A0A518D4T6_9BACT|nr:flagellar protein FliS [Planctomycetes bacterium Pla163]
MATDPTALYKESLLENAPPIKIVRLLYEKAILHMERARRLNLATQAALFTETLDKADAIVVELRLSLDPAPAPQISSNLESLYLFVEERLSEALAQRNPEELVPAIGVMNDLLDAWRSIELGGQAAA